jgi:hypothetical protein
MRARFTQEGNIRKVGVLLSTSQPQGMWLKRSRSNDTMSCQPGHRDLGCIGTGSCNGRWRFSPFSVEPTFARYARYPRQSRREANSVVGLSLTQC